MTRGLPGKASSPFARAGGEPKADGPDSLESGGRLRGAYQYQACVGDGLSLLIRGARQPVIAGQWNGSGGAVTFALPAASCQLPEDPDC